VRRLEAALVEEVRALRGADPLGPVLVVVPSRLLGAHLLGALVRALGGVAGLDVLTLPELAERIAGAPLGRAGRRPVPPAADRLLVAGAIRAAIPPAGGYFSAVAGARNFPAALLRTLLDVKRAGLGPTDLEAAFPDSAKVRELAACHRALDAGLRRHGFADASDLLAAAARRVEDEPACLGARAVLVFGFVELNALEARLVAACRRAVTLREYPASVDAAAPPPADAIEIVAAPGEEREVREIARVILAHVEAGGRFDEVGLLLRQPAAYRAAIRDVFEAAAIPYAWGAPPALADTRAGRTLRLLLEAWRSEFARPAVLELLAFADLRSRPGTSPAEWERLSRQAGIVGGAREWRERLDRLGRRLAAPPAATPDDREDDAGAAAVGDDAGAAAWRVEREALEALRRVVRLLLRGLGGDPGPAPLAARVDAIVRTVGRLLRATPETAQVLAAVGRLRELEAVEDAVSLDGLAALVEAALAAPAEAPRGPAPGRVFVGELGPALGVPFALTVVPGLVEGGFPSAPRQDPILLDAERRRFDGLPVAETARALERVRFALAVGSGARRLLLTYPRIDAASGRPRVPSFLLLDLLQQVTGRSHDFEALERFPGWRAVPLHPAPPGARARPLDAREWLVTRALAARAAPAALLAALPAAARGVTAIRLREGTDVLTAHDGLLAGGVDPAAAPLAPTALETYATCPFRYLLERVFALRPVEEPDRILVMQAIDRGELVHAVLDETLRRLQAAGALPLTAARLAEARAVLGEVFDARAADAERRGLTGLPVLWAAERARLRAELLAALDAETQDADAWVPERFEAAFGVPWREAAAAALAYRLPDGSELRLRGSIDRIDRSRDGARARVLDYKTGRVRVARTADRLAGGRALQLPIYRLAAEALLAEHGAPAVVDEAQYYHVIGPDAGTRIRFTRAGWEARRADFDRLLAALVDGIRAGRFFQRPDACARGPCAFDLACGAERRRWAEAKRADPAAAAHEALAAIE
jgi:ATP-dependent helicase/nuclease subunit B